MEEITVFHVIKTVAFWLTPLVLLEGILLLLLRADKYTKLENRLGKEVGGIRKKMIPRLERDIYILQNWLLKKTPVVGVFFVVYAILLFIALKG
ncbi:MAG: hypothetical protein WC301_06305 [Candidatus Omnitrophota bacterium]|jgi:hypothetical protein